MPFTRTLLFSAVLASLGAMVSMPSRATVAETYTTSAQTTVLPKDAPLIISDQTLASEYTAQEVNTWTAWSMYGVGQTTEKSSAFAQLKVKDASLSAMTIRTSDDCSTQNNCKDPFDSSVIDIGSDGWVSLEGRKVDITLDHANFSNRSWGTSAAITVGAFTPPR